MAGRGKRKDRQQEQHQDHEDGSRNNFSNNNIGYSYPPPHHRHMSHDHQVQTSSCNINSQLSFNLNPHERGPFGLTLNIPPSLIETVSKLLKSTREKRQKNNHQQIQSNSKPSNIPAVFFNIGSWNWESKNEQDLVVKFYYKKRRLVWEFLHGSLKKKIEIRWANLSAIKASVDEDKKGRLQIELHQPPEYFNETGFKAKTHTNWEATQDFTGNRQATICRRHTILFSPGVLDEHLEKLLKSDNHLSDLSQKPFPVHNSPFFYDYEGPPIPLSSYHHNGSVVPNVQNLAPEPITSFYGYSEFNLPMTGPMLPNSNDITKTDGEQTSNELQSKINEIQKILFAPFREEDDTLPYSVLASPIPQNIVDSTCKLSTQYDQQNNFDPPSCNGTNDHVGQSNINHVQHVTNEEEEDCWSQLIRLHEEHFGSNCSMADLMLPNLEEKVTNVSTVEQKEVPLAPISDQDDYLLEYLPTEVTMEQTVDSTCRPSTQNQHSWLPFQAERVDSSSVGGVMNHVNDEIFNEQQFINDGLASQAEPSSWLHSQVNMHGFHNGGNGQLPLQAFGNGGNGFDNGGNGELPLQAFDNGGNGELPLRGFENCGNVFRQASRNGHQEQHIYFARNGRI